MSLNVNKIILVGRVTKAPELKTLPSGQSICNLSIATNRTYTQNGEKKEDVEFSDVVVFGIQAENTAKYVEKGQEVAIVGRNQTRQWEKDGVKHYRTEIIADSIQFGTKAPKVEDTKADYPVQGENGTPNPEDIPF